MSESDKRIDALVADLVKVANDAKAMFGGLSTDQLNWRPAEQSWSIAQCFDHLITTHSLFFREFEEIGKGNLKRSVWERISPFSGYFGKFLIRSLDPENPKKIKTTGRGQPSASEIDGDIIKRFGEHQVQLIDRIQKLPADIDLAKLIITSPMLGVVTYSLDDCLTFVAGHCRRHFLQAERVMKSEGFADSAI